MSEKTFENYDKAKTHSLTMPWKLKTCSVGEDCWCRIIEISNIKSITLELYEKIMWVK